MDDSYIAGFFDGEGSAMIITIKRNTKHGVTYQFRPTVKISQKTTAVLYEIKNHLGFGRVVGRVVNSKNTSDFVICGNENIKEFISRISIFTVVKTKALNKLAELIKIQDCNRNEPYPKETIEKMIDIRDDIKKINGITRSNIKTTYSKELILETMSFPERICWLEKRNLNRKTEFYSYINEKRSSKINPTVFCECGCGEKLLKFDHQNRERLFIQGHNNRGKKWKWKNHVAK